MDPPVIAWTAAAATGLLASFVPTDTTLDRYFKSWLPKRHHRYRLKLVGLHLVATAIVAAGASSLGWEPETTSDGFNAAANGVAWALAAVALLRAELPGSHAGEAPAGLSLLRAVSKKMVSDLASDVGDAIREALRDSSVTDLGVAALRCRTIAYPPREDGTLGPDSEALGASIVLLWKEADSMANDPAKVTATKEHLTEIVVGTVTKYRLVKCW
ncbi:MAG TPA: hypothetical protein VGV93_07680 [Acidimicrobiales bacterium]|nr:hypothetical protein [Acidimicrobiales bacterium]